MADSFEKRIITQAQTNIEKGLKRMEHKIDDNKTPLAALTNAVKASFDVYRVSTGQPTTINQTNQSPIERGLKYAEILIGKYEREDARKIFRASKTAQIGMGATEEEWIEAETIAFNLRPPKNARDLEKMKDC